MPTDSQQVQANQAKWMTIPKRWPLVNTLDSRSGNFLKDARLVNAYAEKDRATGEYQVEKRPGFSTTPVVNASIGQGQGIYSYDYFGNSTVFPVQSPFGKNSLIVYIQGPAGGPNTAFSFKVAADGSITPTVNLGNVNLGILTTNTIGSGVTFPTKVQFTGLPFGGQHGAQILFGSGASVSEFLGAGPMAYYTDGATLNTLSPGVNGFPLATVPGFVFLDGFVYVMDITGTIWQTATQNQIANWGALAFIQAATDIDPAVQLARQLIYVVAIKQWTTQFFYDAGNPTGSSLSPIPGAQYEFGCLSADTFQNLDGTLFWVTNSKSATYQVVQVDNLNYKMISTPAVERQLDLGPGAVFYSVAYQHAGHRWYVITNVTTNVTMVYDIGEQLWYLWTDFKGNYYPIISRTSPYTGAEWHQDGPTGTVRVLNADYVYPNDYGNIVPVDIYTPNFDAGFDRTKYLSQMRINADQTPGSKLFVSFSDDDYQSFNNPRMIDLARERPFLNDEGSFYRRAYHFRHQANTPLRIRSVDLQMDIGTF
jgi:hypothetical protein